MHFPQTSESNNIKTEGSNFLELSHTMDTHILRNPESFKSLPHFSPLRRNILK